VYRFDILQQGQAMVEYALILVLIAAVAIVVLISMGDQVTSVFSNVSCGLAGHLHMGMGGCATGRPD
jgi:Flp pilus assembly pilin Flp